ncbi:uncharacterized protein CTRU02_215225 [Colletotrichum truncatum]|uniref:Uncharacterized protein n=1 Tax=Colletotrichum truncatum TaxID=5467 RepID=A0ACC3YD86_COLTU|nr:uncharacterized protein CTRU02_12267 [Colletotrichum truncatum]KAF6784806.1 hypothetical protein CTRU02_12267 [Colletotrichum truncatum]
MHCSKAPTQSPAETKLILAIWLAVAFIQSVLLFSRGNQESLSTEAKQRLLFLWAVQILCCLIVFLWSFQDLPVNISPNKRK